MSEAKREILDRIKKALGEVPDSENPEELEVPREYRRQSEKTSEEVADLFARRAGEYKATVQRIDYSAVKSTIAESCRGQKVQKLLIPPGFPREWLPDTIEPLFDDSDAPLSHQEMDESDGVLTTCALAAAETGTIFLDAGEGQGRRALTLLPDYHLCIVHEKQIVELIPEAFAHFEPSVKKEGKPITMISGPSATSDIELSRVEGVHGPRRLEILIIAESESEDLNGGSM